MKLFLIYIKSEHIQDYKGVIVDMIHHIGEYDYSLYAVTSSKSLLNDFMSTRSKDLFYIKEKNVCKEDYNDITSRFNTITLDDNVFMTKSIDKNGLISTKSVKVVSTCFEKDLIVDDEVYYIPDKVDQLCDDDLIYNILMYTPFNIELKYALNEILSLNDFISEGAPKEDWSWGMSAFNIDELNLFIKEFGNTLE